MRRPALPASLLLAVLAVFAFVGSACSEGKGTGPADAAASGASAKPGSTASGAGADGSGASSNSGAADGGAAAGSSPGAGSNASASPPAGLNGPITPGSAPGDACTLLTQSEVESTIGLKIEKVSGDVDGARCGWAPDEGDSAIDILVQRNQALADDAFSSGKEAGNTTPLNIGDSAYLVDRGGVIDVGVLVKGRLLVLTIFPNDYPSLAPNARSIAESLARAAAARFG